MNKADTQSEVRQIKLFFREWYTLLRIHLNLIRIRIRIGIKWAGIQVINVSIRFTEFKQKYMQIMLKLNHSATRKFSIISRLQQFRFWV